MIRIDCVDVSVRCGSKVLVNDFSFSAIPGQILGILGVTGGGKSTLATAISGTHPKIANTVTTGEILYNGLPLYKHLATLRFSIGFVPQKNILETRLTVRSLLKYEASLRLPDDISPSKLDAIVDGVMAELRLTEIQDRPFEVLSGGQIRLINIAVELLTDPDVLFMDEPHEGLDPTTARIFNQTLRKLANRGKTIIIIMHKPEYALLCDSIMFVAKDGHLAFVGPPQQALTFFGKTSIQNIYDTLWENGEGKALAERFARLRSPTVLSSAGQEPYAVKHGGVRQSAILIRREFDVLAPSGKSASPLFASKRNVGRLLGLLIAPVILAALATVGKSHESFNNQNLNPEVVQQAPQLIANLCFIAMILGAIPAAYEIVKGIELYKRARLTYLGLAPFLFSKFFVLGVVALGNG